MKEKRANFTIAMSYSMSDLLQLVVSEGSSDLHIRVGVPPVIRVHGILHRVDGPPLRRKTPRS
jgi:twitching motility protein PilT